MYRNSDPEQLYEPSTGPSGLEEADHRLLMRLIFLLIAAAVSIMISIPRTKPNSVWGLPHHLDNCFRVTIFSTSTFSSKIPKRPYRSSKVKDCDCNHFLLIQERTLFPGTLPMIF